MLRIREIRYPKSPDMAIVISVIASAAAAVWIYEISNRPFGWEELLGVSFFVVVAFLALCFVYTCSTKLRHSPPFRWRRLGRLMADASSKHRFPHRHLEHNNRQFLPMGSIKTIKNMLAETGSVVILANRPRNKPLPRGADTGFEPIPLYGDRARLGDLAVLDQTCVAPTDDPMSQFAPSAFPSLKGLTQKLKTSDHTSRSIVNALTMIPTLVFIALTVPRMLAIVLPIFLIIHISKYFYANREYNWWLVPGGLVMQRSVLMHSGVKPIRIPAESATLFYDYRSKHHCVYIYHADELHKVICDKNLFPYLLAAWFNRARMPSEDELHALFDSR